MWTILLLLVTCLVCINTKAAMHHGKHKQKLKIFAVKSDVQNPINNGYIITLNQLGDDLISNFAYVMEHHNMNPFNVADQNQSMKGITLELTQIKVYNLTNVKRGSDIKIFNDDVQKRMSAVLKLQFYNVELIANYKASVKMAFMPAISFKGILTADLPTIAADVSGTVDFKKINATLDSMVLSMNKTLMKVKLSGRPEDEIANLAMPVIIAMLQGVILQLMDAPIKNQINRVLQQIVILVANGLENIG